MAQRPRTGRVLASIVGTYTGRLPISARELPAGTYSVAVTDPCFTSDSRTVTLARGARQTVTLDTRVRTTQVSTAASDGSTGTVYVDGLRSGTFPGQITVPACSKVFVFEADDGRRAEVRPVLMVPATMTANLPPRPRAPAPATPAPPPSTPGGGLLQPNASVIEALPRLLEPTLPLVAVLPLENGLGWAYETEVRVLEEEVRELLRRRLKDQGWSVLSREATHAPRWLLNTEECDRKCLLKAVRTDWVVTGQVSRPNGGYRVDLTFASLTGLDGSVTATGASEQELRDDLDQAVGTVFQSSGLEREAAARSGHGARWSFLSSLPPSWNAAHEICRGLDESGRWRLPTVDEIAGLRVAAAPAASCLHAWTSELSPLDRCRAKFGVARRSGNLHTHPWDSHRRDRNDNTEIVCIKGDGPAPAPPEYPEAACRGYYAPDFAIRAGAGGHLGLWGLGLELRLGKLAYGAGMPFLGRIGLAVGTGDRALSWGMVLGPADNRGGWFVSAHGVWNRPGLIGRASSHDATAHTEGWGVGWGGSVGWDFRLFPYTTLKVGAGAEWNPKSANPLGPIVLELSLGGLWSIQD